MSELSVEKQRDLANKIVEIVHLLNKYKRDAENAGLDVEVKPIYRNQRWMYSAVVSIPATPVIVACSPEPVQERGRKE